MRLDDSKSKFSYLTEQNILKKLKKTLQYTIYSENYIVISVYDNLRAYVHYWVFEMTGKQRGQNVIKTHVNFLTIFPTSLSTVIYRVGVDI